MSPTHRILHRDGTGFFGKRPLAPTDRRDADGFAVWGDADRDRIQQESERLGVASETLEAETEILEVCFVPKQGFEDTSLEPLTDDPAVCPEGTYAAFETFR